ncbi:4Fe-4S dicluster domain-containing protein [candidate division WOR-3 bacterium]|nr:4Fe-4S dicluster domain-containing protein [candidate division WOR-3 bacterium]
MEKSKINFKFREKLNKTLEGKHHNYCYQCGACASICPAARYSEKFNPRNILLMTLTGLEDELIRKDSPIWLCTNCYSCYERCPQDVRPIEIIITLKNIAVEEGKAPDEITRFSEAVEKTGESVVHTTTVDRRREALGLKKLEKPEIDELKKLLETE